MRGLHAARQSHTYSRPLRIMPAVKFAELGTFSGKFHACGGLVRVLAVDIAGAFDKVSHNGVLHKAERCGISGPLLAWLRSYLTDRHIRVVIGGQSSPTHRIQSGVPQGSILGPTLFLLYVNDAEDHLPDGAKLAVYADDTTLYKCITTRLRLPEETAILQQAVDSLAAWGSRWRIEFEPTKSQALTISHHRSLTPPPERNTLPRSSRARSRGAQASWRHLRQAAGIPQPYPTACSTRSPAARLPP